MAFLGKIGEQATDEWKSNPDRIPPVEKIEKKSDVQKRNGVLLLLLVVLPFCYSYSNAQQVNKSTGTGQSGDILILGNGWTGNVSQCTHNYNCWAGQTDQGDIHHGYDQSTGMGNTYY